MIKTLQRQYIPYLRDIDIRAHKFPLTETVWDNIHNVIVRVWLVHNIPRGFAAFSVASPNEICVFKLAVHPEWQCMGIGQALHSDLLRLTKWKKLTTRVHEENINTILWLQKNGWLATEIIKENYPDNRDAFVFEREN